MNLTADTPNPITQNRANNSPSSSPIHLGTSAWNFDEWRGVFYPEKMMAKEYLRYYSSKFNSVEVNTSFYGLPRLSTAEEWAKSVPPGFTFSLKMPRAISHEKRLVDCEEETLAFLDLLHTLEAKAGVGFLQLPPSFTRTRGGKVLARYIEWLGTELHKSGNKNLRLAVEVRASDLLTPAFAGFVAQHGIALVLGDRIIPDGTKQPGPEGKLAPDVTDAWLALIDAQRAPHFAMLRWIGDNRDSVWADKADRNRKFVFARDDRLALWSKRMKKLHQLGITIFGYMHNPYEGYAPTSLARLRERLVDQLELPAWPPSDWINAPADQLSLFD